MSNVSSCNISQADEYKNYMFESEKDKALKENESKNKAATKSDKEHAWGWIPFGDHPLKSERCREDLHGPCARTTRASREV